ncbi:unnamed protein product [Lymnaea stagnalis]|uniref:G-protein coupled receptors family 1 profile domain-containing protein n=1 Tax=Lymnaea stagnalis TaxID=6523 RepID=A0AAV2HZ93_LYMST
MDSTDIYHAPKTTTPRIGYAHHDFIAEDIMATSEQRRITEIVLELTIDFVISLLGIFTNVVIVAVFARQGFKDSMSISMTTVALWDLVKSLGGFMQRLAGPMVLFSPAAAKSWANLSVMVFNYLVSVTCYVTSVLAAYVAVERCLCVTVPLKVKWLLTPKTALVVCVAISVVVFGSFFVIFFIYDVYWVYDPTYNETVAVFEYNSFSVNNTALFGYYNMSGTLWPLVSLVVIVISTIIISYKLRKSAEFRYRTKSVSGPVTSDSTERIQPQRYTKKSGQNQAKTTVISRRDQQVVKMLLVIIGVYIVHLAPRVANYLAKYLVFDYYYLRKYHNLFSIVAYVVFVFDFINGSINLFVFFAMSTAFRRTALELLTCRCRCKQLATKKLLY